VPERILEADVDAELLRRNRLGESQAALARAFDCSKTLVQRRIARARSEERRLAEERGPARAGARGAWRGVGGDEPRSAGRRPGGRRPRRLRRRRGAAARGGGRALAAQPGARAGARRAQRARAACARAPLRARRRAEDARGDRPRFGLTRERIRQIQVEALRRLASLREMQAVPH
jgi:hypothetical protein